MSESGRSSPGVVEAATRAKERAEAKHAQLLWVPPAGERLDDVARALGHRAPV